MDLTQLSDADLMALKSGNLANVSDAGLMALKGEPKQTGSQLFKEAIAPAKNYTGTDFTGGLIHGAGEIGSTIMRALPNAIGGDTADENAQRRARLAENVRTVIAPGADPNSMGYGTGKITSEFMGTSGLGGMLGGAAGKLGANPAIINALKTGGMQTGEVAPGVINAAKNLGLKLGAGGALGAATAATINPEDWKTGMLWGAGIPGGVEAIKGAGKLAGNLAAGFAGIQSGAGTEAVKQAFRAGQEGNPVFMENMQNKVPATDVLDAVKQNLKNMTQQKSAEYRSGMVDIRNDKSVLSFDGINKALGDAIDTVSFKGQIKNQRAADALGEIQQNINAWKKLDPAEYHTPEGLDALKQRIGGILEGIPFEEKTARSVAGNVYNSIKSEINKQAPTYAKVMQGYGEASDTIREIERALSVGEKSAADTGMRKLQSLMRNNANTNFGNRLNLAQTMEQQGGNEVLPALAGQALNTWEPRGLIGRAAALGTGAAGIAGNPAFLPMLAMSSPKAVGYGAYGGGALARLLEKTPTEPLKSGDISRLAVLLQGAK